MNGDLMGAFTQFSDEALASWVRIYGLGSCRACSPTPGGIENSNYFLTLEKDGQASDFVLTLLEDIPIESAPFFSKLLTHLDQRGLPVAAPRSTLDGMNYTLFCGKPALLVPRLPGAHITKPETSHCQAIGDFLARMHLALGDFAVDPRFARANPYGLEWVDQTLPAVIQNVGKEAANQMTRLADLYRELQQENLPTGYIHGDLFKDNALFDISGFDISGFDISDWGHPGEAANLDAAAGLDQRLPGEAANLGAVAGLDQQLPRLTGVIDFYHACEDFLLQDLAIAINDWCRPESGGLTIDAARKDALLQGYEASRTLTARERDLLVPTQQTSALRFALTRLLSGDPPRKDPAEMLTLASNLGML